MTSGIPVDTQLPEPLPPAEFGRRVLRLRRALKLTQVALAARIGIDRADLCKTEKGRGARNPSVKTILRFAEALGVPPNELMVKPVHARRVAKPAA
jgi:transcriptional regulator with XRE-family HTH domain